jgi:type IV pilus assembly protein PilE
VVDAARHRLRGLTLIECCITVAIVGVMASLAWPSQSAGLQRARRADASVALMRLQMAQEQYRALHGRYSAELSVLKGAALPRSPEGHYRIALEDAGVDSVTLRAEAAPGSAQQNDASCRVMTVRLMQGLADNGPDGRCWGT